MTSSRNPRASKRRQQVQTKAADATAPKPAYGRDELKEVAQRMLDPTEANGVIAHSFMSKSVTGEQSLHWPDFADAISDQVETVQGGDTKPLEALLMSQALSLQAMFCEMSRRAAINMGGDISVVEAYMRLALKAQAQSRTNVETLAKMKQPREQIVRHVTVHEGGQAVVADQFHHHHQGGTQNANRDGQPHAIAAPPVAALRGTDPLGAGVPITGDAQREMSNARRPEPGSTEGE